MPDTEIIYGGYLLNSLSSNSSSFYKNLLSVSLPKLKQLGGILLYGGGTYATTFPNLVNLSLPALEIINGGIIAHLQENNATGQIGIKKLILPSLRSIENGYVMRVAWLSTTYDYAQNLTELYLPSLITIASGNLIYSEGGGSGLKNLIDVTVGEMTTNLYVSAWNPITVLADADKKAQLVDNIKNHILAKVSDATGGTQLVFTVSTNMFNAIASETITWNDEEMTLADAFLTKNWRLAGA